MSNRLQVTLQVWITFLVNKAYHFITRPCRMYHEKPEETVAGCHLCAKRGGYLRCRRSYSLAARNEK